MRVSMGRAVQCVKDKISFQSDSIYGRWDGNERYVVYAANNLPLYVYERVSDKWYRNSSEMAATYLELESQWDVRPDAPCDDINTHEDMTSLAAGGVINMIEAREDRRRMRAVHANFVQTIQNYFGTNNFPTQFP